jgi:hypothetical protein
MKRHLRFIGMLSLVFACLPTQSQVTEADLKPVHGFSVRGQALVEDECQIVSRTADQAAEIRGVPGMHVIDRTPQAPLVLTTTHDVQIDAIICWRSKALLAPNDYLVPLRSGYRLIIKTDLHDDKANRTISLERTEGSFRVRLLAGPTWTKADEEEMKAAIELFMAQGDKGI